METNVIYNCDCLEGLKKLPDHCIDLVVTDPPYEYSNGKDVFRGGGNFGTKSREFYNQLDNFASGFDMTILDELVRVMKKINIYIFCNKKQLPMYIDYFVKERNCNWQLLTWHKSNPIPACGNHYLNDTEFIFFAAEPGLGLGGSYDTKKTYYVTGINKSDKDKYGHPTVKPQFMIENFIENSSKEDDIILDPFMGSGTTAVAAKVKNRKYIGWEINEKFYETALNRLKEIDHPETNALF